MMTTFLIILIIAILMYNEHQKDVWYVCGKVVALYWVNDIEKIEYEDHVLRVHQHSRSGYETYVGYVAKSIYKRLEKIGIPVEVICDE